MPICRWKLHEKSNIAPAGGPSFGTEGAACSEPALKLHYSFSEMYLLALVHLCIAYCSVLRAVFATGPQPLRPRWRWLLTCQATVFRDLAAFYFGHAVWRSFLTFFFNFVPLLIVHGILWFLHISPIAEPGTCVGVRGHLPQPGTCSAPATLLVVDHLAN